MSTTKKPGARAEAARNGTKPKRVKRLDIGCGQNKKPGFFGIDSSPNSQADLIWDLWETPWPIAANCVEEAVSSHLVEHIPHWRPGWERDGWWRFFDELHRVMKDQATIYIVHPYVHNSRAFWDPAHERYIHEQTWYYLDREWRLANGIDHYAGDCDFEVVNINAGLMGDLGNRNLETQNFARTHYWNALADLEVILKARKE